MVGTQNRAKRRMNNGHRFIKLKHTRLQMNATVAPRLFLFLISCCLTQNTTWTSSGEAIHGWKLIKISIAPKENKTCWELFKSKIRSVKLWFIGGFLQLTLSPVFWMV